MYSLLPGVRTPSPLACELDDRWTSGSYNEPLGYAGGQWNLTAYCDNDPVNYTDPSGLQGIGPKQGPQQGPQQGLSAYPWDNPTPPLPHNHGTIDLSQDGSTRFTTDDQDPILRQQLKKAPDGKQITAEISIKEIDKEICQKPHSQDAFSPPPIPVDPTQPPAPGWRWEGKGAQGSREGTWVSPDGRESLHNDLNHPEGKDPHWGWKDQWGNKWDYFPDTNKWVADPNNNDNKPQPTFPDGTYLKAGGCTIATLGLGYLIYRGIRLLPSLAPPAWPSLPFNLGTP